MQSVSLAQRFLLVLLGLCTFFASSSCKEAGVPTGPQAAQAPRYVVLSPALAQNLRTLGAGDRVVGRHGFDAWSPQEIPVVGDNAGIDYEALERVSPTAVLLEASATGPPPRLRERAAQAGWELHSLPNLTLQEVEEAVRSLAAVVGPSADENLELWLTEWDAQLAPDERFSGLRPALLLGVNPPALIGPGSVHFEMLERIGADPVPERGAPYQSLTLEDLAVLDPGVIIVFDAGGGTPLEELLGPITRLNLDAVESGRVVVITSDRALLPATSLVEVARELREGLSALGAPSE